MILFFNDWKKYPNAIPDFQTKNESFLRVSSIYRKMGVRNHSFMLSLLNPALRGVDPHDPNLTLEQIAMVVVEAKLNYWYFVREVLRAPAISGADDNPYRASRGNISVAWLFLNAITTYHVQIRQTGKSFTMWGIAIYLAAVAAVNKKMNLLTKDDRLRTETMEILRDIESSLPYYMRQRTNKDAANTMEFTVKSLGNKLVGLVPSSSEKQAFNKGRGMTTDTNFFDEFNFQNHIRVSSQAALAAGGAARDAARAAKEIYGTMISSTVGRTDDRDGAYGYKVYSESAPWTEKMLDCLNRDELEKTVRVNSRAGVLRVLCEFNHSQLGYSDEWLERTMEESTASGMQAEMDFFNIWQTGTKSHPLPIHILKSIKNSKIEPLYTSISTTESYIVKWYIPQHARAQVIATHSAVLSVDPSEAIGNDDIALVLRDAVTGETIAAGVYNETNILVFSQWLFKEWLVKYPTIILVIESRSTGPAIIDNLLEFMKEAGMNPFKRMFNTVVNNSKEHPELFKQVTKVRGRALYSLANRLKKHFGFKTSGSGMMARSTLYGSVLSNSAKYTGNVTNDSMLINQIATLTTKNGRIDHSSGNHDDMCIAWLMGYWFLTQASNVEFYGINATAILSELLTENKEEPKCEVDKVIDSQQQQMRRRLFELIESYREMKNPMIMLRTEREMRYLDSKVSDITGEDFSLDAIIAETKMNNKRKRYR